MSCEIRHYSYPTTTCYLQEGRETVKYHCTKFIGPGFDLYCEMERVKTQTKQIFKVFESQGSSLRLTPEAEMFNFETK